MTQQFEVGRVDEFDNRSTRIVETNIGEIGVIRIDQEYYALLNRCLHQQGPVCRGNIEPEITGDYSEVGERVKEEYGEKCFIKCPWHGWEYNIETGDLAGHSELSLPTFDVIVEDERVYVLV